MKMYFDELSYLGRRYAHAVKVSWNARRDMVQRVRTKDELNFLPAVLELTETPVSPLPRWTMRILVSLSLITILWAAFGKLDVVAVASGKIIADSHTKSVQAVEIAIVRKILVAEGQKVAEGQVLLELDAVGVRSDLDKATKALDTATVNSQRLSALIFALDHRSFPVVSFTSDITEKDAAAAQQLATSEYASFEKKVATLESALMQKRAERFTALTSIAALREYARISSERVADYKRLLAKNYVSRQEYLVREQESITSERELMSQVNKTSELDSAVATAKEQLDAAKEETRLKWMDQAREFSEQKETLVAELGKANERRASMQLVAPVGGTVEQVVVHSVGGVVTPGQALMAIVPLKDALEVEATVLNQDIGFIHPGQAVVAKIDSFPYTKYGFIDGVVTLVSTDAIVDEKRGLVFSAHIKLQKSTMLIDGTKIRLSPGMSSSVEIKTGQRTLLEYFLDPLEVHIREGMRER